MLERPKRTWETGGIVPPWGERLNAPSGTLRTVKFSSLGTPFSVWEPRRMPSINPEALRSAIYLYPSRAAAEKGEAIGGSGFLISVRSKEINDWIYPYAVTNRHVITSGNPVIRLNTKFGLLDILEADVDFWEPHSGGADISVMQLTIDPNKHDHRMISETMILSKEIVEGFSIGHGDDVFMVSRLTTNDGKAKNAPAVRFGCISQMPIPGEPIPDGHGSSQESFTVDMRSIPGHSGSAVYVNIPPGSVRYGPNEQRGLFPQNLNYQWLLGIDWCHLPYMVQVLDDSFRPVEPKQWVQLNSGVAGVVPAWKLHELLYSEKLMKIRQRCDRDELNRRALNGTPSLDAAGGIPAPTVEDAAALAADDASPNHLEDFSRLVDAAARKRPQGDQP